jgi:hypothetical protein
MTLASDTPACRGAGASRSIHLRTAECTPSAPIKAGALEGAGRAPIDPAALSFLTLLSPDEVKAALRRRRDAVSASLEEGRQAFADAPVPRLFLLEDEYQLAMQESEVRWLDSVLAELESGALTWVAGVDSAGGRADGGHLPAELAVRSFPFSTGVRRSEGQPRSPGPS